MTQGGEERKEEEKEEGKLIEHKEDANQEGEEGDTLESMESLIHKSFVAENHCDQRNSLMNSERNIISFQERIVSKCTARKTGNIDLPSMFDDFVHLLCHWLYHTMNIASLTENKVAVGNRQVSLTTAARHYVTEGRRDYEAYMVEKLRDKRIVSINGQFDILLLVDLKSKFPQLPARATKSVKDAVINMKDMLKRWMMNHVCLLIRSYFVNFVRSHPHCLDNNNPLLPLRSYSSDVTLNSFIILAVHVGYGLNTSSENRAKLIFQKDVKHAANDWCNSDDAAQYLLRAFVLTNVMRQPVADMPNMVTARAVNKNKSRRKKPKKGKQIEKRKQIIQRAAGPSSSVSPSSAHSQRATGPSVSSSTTQRQRSSSVSSATTELLEVARSSQVLTRSTSRAIQQAQPDEETIRSIVSQATSNAQLDKTPVEIMRDFLSSNTGLKAVSDFARDNGDFKQFLTDRLQEFI